MAADERLLAGVVVGIGEGLVEVGEETGDSPSGGGVAFDLAVPAVVDSLGRKVQLGGMSLAEPRCVGRGGHEFGAAEEEVALAGAFGGEAEAVPELEFGLKGFGGAGSCRRPAGATRRCLGARGMRLCGRSGSGLARHGRRSRSVATVESGGWKRPFRHGDELDGRTVGPGAGGRVAVPPDAPAHNRDAGLRRHGIRPQRGFPTRRRSRRGRRTGRHRC